jgi:hypothetical protein
VAYLLRLALATLIFASAPASAQVVETPPAPLWRMDANGDAVQTDLGFVLPARWRGFERERFTSSRPDGASVMVHYRRADGVRLGIHLQLRFDIRGIPLTGENGVERNWSLLRDVADAEFSNIEGQPEILADERIIWGRSDRPNARMRLRRIRHGGAEDIQGLWYRNIGLWAVLVRISGPVERRAEIEAAGPMVMNGMDWPAAPLNADLRATLPTWLPALRDCPASLNREGNGRLIAPGPIVASMIGMGISTYFLENPQALPHPLTQPRAYCRIETFRAGQTEIIALGWTGDVSAYPAVRYAFLIDRSATMFQYESLFTVPPEQAPAGMTRLVWLTASNERKVAAVRVFSDWPSYAEAKRIMIETGNPDEPRPVVEVIHPPGQIRITPINAGPLPPRPQGAAPTP